MTASFAIAACAISFNDYPSGLAGGSGGSPSASSSISASSGMSQSSSTGVGGHGGGDTTGGAGGAIDAGFDAADASQDSSAPDTGPGHDAGVDSGPPALASCQAWLTQNPSSPSGIYALRDASGNVYDAYCEMVGSGGGWTLAMKIDGSDYTVLDYPDPLWTNNVALNPGAAALDTNEAKLASFWSVAMSELRVGMLENGVTRWLVVPIQVPPSPTTLLDLMKTGAQTMLGRPAWEGLLSPVGSLQTVCTWEGLNPDGMIRIGIVGDNSSNCLSPDSYLGFGAVRTGEFTAPAPPSGNIAVYSPDNGDINVTTFGYVMVR